MDQANFKSWLNQLNQFSPSQCEQLHAGIEQANDTRVD